MGAENLTFRFIVFKRTPSQAQTNDNKIGPGKDEKEGLISEQEHQQNILAKNVGISWNSSVLPSSPGEKKENYNCVIVSMFRSGYLCLGGLELSQALGKEQFGHVFSGDLNHELYFELLQYWPTLVAKSHNDWISREVRRPSSIPFLVPRMGPFNQYCIISMRRVTVYLHFSDVIHREGRFTTGSSLLVLNLLKLTCI